MAELQSENIVKKIASLSKNAREKSEETVQKRIEKKLQKMQQWPRDSKVS